MDARSAIGARDGGVDGGECGCMHVRDMTGGTREVGEVSLGVGEPVVTNRRVVTGPAVPHRALGISGLDLDSVGKDVTRAPQVLTQLDPAGIEAEMVRPH